MFNLVEIITLLKNPESSNREFSSLGFVDTEISDSLTFVEKEKFLDAALDNRFVQGVLVSETISEKYPHEARLIPCKSPQIAFVKLHNQHGNTLKRFSTKIDRSADVSPHARVSKNNVLIGPNVVIEDFCVVSENSSLESGVILRSGSVVGSTALYVGKGNDGRALTARHFGSTRIASRVEVGPNSVIDKGMFSYDTTTIGPDTFIGPLSNISHGVRMGSGNVLAAGVKISGYTTIGDENWFGPSVVVSHKLQVGSGNYVALGSNVLRSISSNNTIVGNRLFSQGFPIRNS